MVSPRGGNNEEMVFCRLCHRAYPLSEILGIQGDVEALRNNPELLKDEEGLASSSIVLKPWAEVRLPPPAPTGLFGSRFGRRKVDESQVADLLANSFDPYCPQLHFLVDQLADAPLFITVAGNVSSSKSTYLTGLVAEMQQSARLGTLPLLANIRPSQARELHARTKLVYQDNADLPPTQEEKQDKGFVVRLQWPNKMKRNLAFIDVSGEVISDIAQVAQFGRFLYSSDGVILLIDPGGFPDPNGWMKPLDETARLVTADLVDGLADGLEAVTQKELSKLGIPLIVVVAKSDQIEWPAQEGDSAPEPSIGSDQVEATLQALQRESQVVRNYLIDKGLEAIVTTAEARFGHELVRYAKVSALGQGKEDHKLKRTARRPDGCWKPVALVLRAKGLL